MEANSFARSYQGVTDIKAGRKEEDRQAGRPEKEEPGVAKKNRYTRNINIEQRNEDWKTFKQVVKMARQLQLDHDWPSLYGHKWYNHGEHDRHVSGALLPGDAREKRYDDGTCGAHIYGPIYCGNKLPDQIGEPKYCYECFVQFGTTRRLCKYCCKSLIRCQHNYCLSEQCPGEKKKKQGRGNCGGAWLRDDRELKKWLNRYGLKPAGLSTQYKWDIIEWYHPNWKKRAERHDQWPEQGAILIDRRKAERHTAYGDDIWNKHIYQPAREVYEQHGGS